MPFYLGAISRQNLEGVHPDLVRVVGRAIAITPVDFRVIDGRRSLAEEKRLVADGASTTTHSRHLTGHAVDLGAFVGGTVVWDWDDYPKIAAAMKQAAAECGVPVEWGGDWIHFKDGTHFQLPWDAYPA